MVLDTNVLVAAGFQPRSASARIVEAIEQGRLRMVWDDAVRREVERILRQIPPLRHHRFSTLFRGEDRHHGRTRPEDFGGVPDPEDRKFAALAHAADAVLVTNDEHLLRGWEGLGRKEVTIMTPATFWDTLEAEAAGADGGTSDEEESMQTREVPQRVVTAFNAHDAAAVAASYAEDATFDDPMYEQPLRGREAIRADFEELFTAFPDVALDLVNVVAESDAVAYEVIMRGTHDGPLTAPDGDLPPTGRRLELRACHFMHLRADGLVTADRRYYDVAAFLGQLGLKEA